jgi:hypothetical protein
MSQSHTDMAIMTWQSTSSFDTQSWKRRPCHMPKYGRDRPNVAFAWRPDYDKTIPLSLRAAASVFYWAGIKSHFMRVLEEVSKKQLRH